MAAEHRRPPLLLAILSVAALACIEPAPRSTQNQASAPRFWPLAGTYASSWANPMTFQQSGDRALARFDRNGTMECAWHPSGVYLCTWRSDAGNGLARIWWQGDRPVGQYGLGSSADNGGRIDFWRQAAPSPPPASTPAAPAAGYTPPASTADQGGGSAGCSGTLTPPPGAAAGASCSYNSTCPDDMRCYNGRCTPSLGTKCGASSDCSRIGNKYACKTSGPWKMDGVCSAR